MAHKALWKWWHLLYINPGCVLAPGLPGWDFCPDSSLVLHLSRGWQGEGTPLSHPSLLPPRPQPARYGGVPAAKGLHSPLHPPPWHYWQLPTGRKLGWGEAALAASQKACRMSPPVVSVARLRVFPSHNSNICSVGSHSNLQCFEQSTISRSARIIWMSVLNLNVQEGQHNVNCHLITSVKNIGYT